MPRYKKQIPPGKGNWYWYDQTNGVTTYLGPVNPKRAPRKKLGMVGTVLHAFGGSDFPIDWVETFRAEPGEYLQEKAFERELEGLLTKPAVVEELPSPVETSTETSDTEVPQDQAPSDTPQSHPDGEAQSSSDSASSQPPA